MRPNKKQKVETKPPEVGLFTNFKNRGKACCAAIWNLLRFTQNTENETNNIMDSEGGMTQKRIVAKSNPHITGKALRLQSQKGFSRTRKKRYKTFRKVVKKPCEKFCSKMKKKNSKALGSKRQGYTDDQCIKLDIVLKAPKQQLNKKKKKCLRKPKTKKPGKSLRKTIHKPGQKLNNKKKNSTKSHMISKSSTSQGQNPIFLAKLLPKDKKSCVGSPKNISQATIFIPFPVINECIKKNKKRKMDKTMRKKIKKPGKKCQGKKKIPKQAFIEPEDLLKRFNELLLQSAATHA
ncbi:uncharacterized protein LOC119689539 [Teleopsis dalmanni]|uniref:uncharacterized protein LOC119689539 n=1 Tax=Teleopsis dalmanni TaxID=139649 RepID=UPI0018CE4699|nr:uncharacterized protein LOC119689539 [Teleopsis dalmanni]XP_037960313.1 uncharacterized protein LOC119689539 [Teleopsis dalmanni]XP_037960314.1 uncharacterized protein LOC119689539 [Teleopsis dalmanni]XP_037960315.1 uncharacterized protein LOC119689539 [Teleopsis dalmanni]XP_037960316.1 uncharacterized protein LOC119689539 [Teleopsis dalmanni]